MESKKINQLATELTPALSDLTIIGDPTTGISKKITLSQMASLFTGTVEEYANLAAFPLVGTADTIYIALDTNIIYRWNTGTSAYVELSPNIVTSLVFSDANGFDGNISLVGSTATLTITTALTTGSVPFIGASGALSQDNANLFFDDTNNRLGINTNVPTTALDVFGSGIIGRLNGTSTNNAYLGFASGGTNQWSIGNVQSDQRFRIYSEANTSELISVLQTGEFGIGIANPLTKLHIFGGASALIANLDANTSVAKSISFRSGNSSRINLEVSGTESGSNAGADLFIRRYSDAGALIDTPLFIKRSTGNIGLGTLTPARQLSLYGGTIGLYNSSTGETTTDGYTMELSGTTAYLWNYENGSLNFGTNNTSRFVIGSTGAATFSNFLGINGSPATAYPLEVYINSSTAYTTSSRGNTMRVYNSNLGSNTYAGIELGSAGPSNDGLAGINAVVTDAGSAALTFYTRNSSTFSEKMRIAANGSVSLGSNSNSADTSLLNIKQSSTAYNNGIYLERGGERNGYFMYIGGALDSLTFRRNYFGTQSDVMSMTRDGFIGINNASPSTPLHIISGKSQLTIDGGASAGAGFLLHTGLSGSDRRNWFIGTEEHAAGDFVIKNSTSAGGNANAGLTRIAISRNGDLGIGASEPTSKIHAVGINTSSANHTLYLENAVASILFRVRNDGYIGSPTTYNNTTAAGANLNITSSGFFERSTSSIRFKTNVEDLSINTTEVLSKMRPIWYRSLGQNDRKDWSWYGFIAEELALIEPRLVHWGYDSSAYETIEIKDEEGNVKEETKLKEDAELIPDGVQYERITVFLVAELQKMRKELDALKTK